MKKVLSVILVLALVFSYISVFATEEISELGVCSDTACNHIEVSDGEASDEVLVSDISSENADSQSVALPSPSPIPTELESQQFTGQNFEGGIV